MKNTVVEGYIMTLNIVNPAGSYLRICAQDMDQQAKPAYFDFFEYKAPFLREIK